MAPSSNPAAVHARAPGKINVFFKVGQLQDDGYHDVASAYQALSLYEDVRAVHSDGFEVSFTGPESRSDLPLDASNLAIKAAQLLARTTRYRGGVSLSIEKNVPIAGGMGGGSADAAATLVACDALWGTGLTREELAELGASLGADVPFALLGGTAVGTGRGDMLSPALAKGDFHWVLALSDHGLSTPEVYTALDRHRERHVLDIRPADVRPEVSPSVLQALRAGDPMMLADVMHNDLQAAALGMLPELTRVLEIGEENGSLGGIVSGSGPTVAFLVDGAEDAYGVQIALSTAGFRAVQAHGPVHGARLVD